MRLFSAISVALALLLFTLVGCSERQVPTPTPVPATPTDISSATPVVQIAEPITQTVVPPTPTAVSGRVLLWHSWSQRDGDALATVLSQFTSRYPGLDIETLFIAQPDLLSGYSQAVQAGGGPDLILAPNTVLRDLVTLGVVGSIDESLSDQEIDDFWPGAIDGMRWQQRLYGLPVTMQTVAMFYNHGLIQDNLVAQNMSDLLAAAATRPESGIGLYNNLFHLYWGIPAFGSELLDDSGRAVLEVAGGTDAYLAWLAQVNQLTGSYVSADYGMLVDRFKKQEYAYFVDGLWSSADLRSTLGADLRVQPLPGGPAGAAQPWAYMDGLYFNPNHDAGQRARAMLLAREITSPLAGAEYARTAGTLSANRHTQIDDEIIAGFQLQAATASALPLRAEMDQAWGPAGDMFYKVIEAGRAPDEVVLETSTLINEANGR